jgi:hypothetical protein
LPSCPSSVSRRLCVWLIDVEDCIHLESINK